MSVLTSAQINSIWISKSSLLDYTYVCEDGNLYKGVKGGGLQRALNSNYDTWLSQKKLNANDSIQTFNSSSNNTSNSNNQLPTIVTNVVEDTNSDTSVLTYDNDGNLIKKVLSLNGSITETKTFEYGSDGGLTSVLSQGINISADLDGESTISNAQLALIVSLGSSLVGSGDITTASLVGTIALAGALTGTGNITAGLNVVAFMNSALSGSGSLSAELKGLLGMSADIYVNESTFTVNQLVEGVWGAVAASYNVSGTMGAKMNAAGTSGDPWSTLVPGSYTEGSAGYVLGNMLSNIPDSVWDELKTTHNTTDSYGKIVQDLEKLSKQIKALTAAGL